LPCNHHQRHDHLVFDGHGGHGFHGQHFRHAVFQIYFADGNAVEELGGNSLELDDFAYLALMISILNPD
jgi:hypothetical protein